MWGNMLESFVGKYMAPTLFCFLAATLVFLIEIFGGFFLAPPGLSYNRFLQNHL